MTLRLFLLGGFRAEWEGAPLGIFESDKARALLAYLAVESDRPQRRDLLVGLFWPESSQTHALHSLSQALFSLKTLIPNDSKNSFFEISPEEIFLRDQNCWVDSREFFELVQACDAHGHGSGWTCRTCLDRLERAAALYKGDFLSGLNLKDCSAFDEWLMQQRQALQQAMILGAGRLSRGFELQGDFEKGLIYARKQIELDPQDESAHRQTMNLLAKLGRRPDALAQYAICQKILRDEIGVEPEAITTALYQEILEKETRTTSIPLSSHDHLPASLTPLIGRQDELEKLCQCLTSPVCRLVSLVGGGGSGKTRLAMAAGRALAPVFPDGVFLVELDTRKPQETLAPLIARVVWHEQPGESTRLFGYATEHGLEERLFSFLQDRKTLLILDGFEGMLAEAGWVGKLLRQAAGVTILATTRIRLNLEAEQVFLLDGLSYPMPGVDMREVNSYAAVQLFEGAARRTHPGFAMSELNGRYVAEICQMLQGMPLGILLAAAWTAVLKPDQIAEQIRHSLDILSTDWSDLPERQRSVKATFEYSLQMLNPADRIAFLRLSVFRGPFSAERAWQVGQATLRTLKTLVDQSLLQPAHEGRFRIHELLRQYALEKLSGEPGEAQAIRDQHCRIMLTTLAAQEFRLKSRELFKTIQEMNLEYTDFLSAWDWAVENGYIDLLDCAVWALGWYQVTCLLLTEGVLLCEKTMERLERDGISPVNLRLWVRLGVLLGDFLNWQFDVERSRQVLERVERMLGQRPDQAASLKREQAFLQIDYGNLSRISEANHFVVLEYYQRGLNLMYGINNPWDIGFGLVHVAMGQGIVGNLRECQYYAELGLEILLPSGDPILISYLLQHRVYALMLTGQSEEAIRNVEEQISYVQGFNDRYHQALFAYMRGVARFHAGQYQKARPLLEQAANLFDRPEEKENRFFILWLLDLIQLSTGNYEAIRLGQGMCEEDRAGLSQTMYRFSVPFTWGILALLRQDWEHAEENILAYLGYMEEVSRQDMMGLPLALGGFTAYRQGDLLLARQRLIKAFENSVKQGYFFAQCASQGVLALILAEAGDLEQAVELYASATSHPGTGNSCWFNDVLGKPITCLAQNLPADVVQAARSRGSSRALAATSLEYLEKLKSSSVLLEGLHSKTGNLSHANR